LDSLTHIALGACVGEAFFERGFGKKAMLWGALAQSIPDIDFISATWMDTPESLLAHRGFTHSILFALLIVPLFALVADKVHRPHNIRFRKWLLFFASEIFLHLFIDGFNNYGVGWLEPFSHQRFSLNTVYVADPFFSLWPGLACIILFALNRYHPKRGFWWRFGVILPLVYLGYCTVNKISMNRNVKEILARQHVPYTSYFSTPAPFQNWLWYVVAGNDQGYNIGYRSVFDRDRTINFHYFPRNDSLLIPIAGQEDLQRLIRFSQNFYTVEKWNDTLVFNDLRFGQMIGWQDPGQHFVFHYFLEDPNDNRLVVQRGRFTGWNRDVLISLVRRIKGH
jgi:inner membrane protein